MKGAQARKEERKLERVWEPLKGMNLRMGSEEYFEKLEEFIERARAHLQGISDPFLRAEQKKLYQEVIEEALSLKLEQILKKEVA